MKRGYLALLIVCLALLTAFVACGGRSSEGRTLSTCGACSLGCAACTVGCAACTACSAVNDCVGCVMTDAPY
jgi:hypothetical protein